MAKKFDFLSPGVNIREIDQSFIPAQVEAEGPIIIGRTRKGPANKPVRITNLDDYVSVFGLPVPGGAGPQGDVWRDGNSVGPTYASYAAQAWLASENSPITVVRIAGDQHPQNDGTAAGKAGWTLGGSLTNSRVTNSTAYGLFVVASGSTHLGTGSLAAVFYANSGFLALSGTAAGHEGETVVQAGTFVESVGTNCEFRLRVGDTASGHKDYNFNFSRNSSKYIRSVFNTNPQLVNTLTTPAAERETYWLGESFVREVEDRQLQSADAGAVYAILLPLESGSTGNFNWGDRQEAAQEAYSGFVVSQLETNQIDLFRFKSLHVGEDIQKNYLIAIENIAVPQNTSANPYGTFTVCIKTLAGQTVERYTNLNFNPSSPNYISKRIGDQYLEWDETDRRYRTYGDFQNQSNIIYVEVKDIIRDGGGQGLLPAGFKGPVRPKGFTLVQGSTGANAFGVTDTEGAFASASITPLAATFANDGALDTPTIILNDQINPAITITISGSSAATRVSATSYTVQSGSTVANMCTNIAAAINLAHTNKDTVIEAVDAHTTVALTSSIPGTFLNTVNIGGTLIAGSTGSMTAFAGGTDDGNFAGAFVKGNASMPFNGGDANRFAAGPLQYTASFKFPSIPLRGDGTEGGAPDPYRAYYGIRPKVSTTSTNHDPDYVDYLRRLPSGINSFTPAGDFEHSYVFTLDDLVINTTNNTVTYTSGSAKLSSPTSYSRKGTGSFGALLDLNVRQFLMPLFGGSEGFDITEKEPLRDDLIPNTRNDVGNSIHYTINKALDSVRDPEVVPANLLLVPGIRKPVITDRVISTAESRKDVLAIIDLEHDYKPTAERVVADTNANSLGSVSSAVSSLRSRRLNSSYAAAFYPWVQISDNLGGGGQLVWVPPSVAALGALGRSESRSELWFAPAGFNRGGLGSLGGPRGPSVLQARQRLDSKERDQLYEVSINPIATFPAEGVVIFGQKTLQADQSALDRINVRRLVLYLKSRVNRVARNLLFDQNVQSTWNRFKNQVEPLLADTQARFGLSGYKLVLDDTTTTPDLIDRNIMYAKIYIKPARAIEYIVVDFVITNTGADFV